MERFGSGWTREEVLQAYPHLTPEALHTVFTFATEVLHDERMM